MSIENPLDNKIEKVCELTIPESELIFDKNFVADLEERLHCRFDGDEFRKIIESLTSQKMDLSSNNYVIYDGLEKFENKSVMDVLFEQGIEEMEVQEKEKVLRNIKYFIENNLDNKVLLADNWYTHLGFYKNEADELHDILCQRHNDSNEWIFWLSKTSAKTNSTHRAIVESIKK